MNSYNYDVLTCIFTYCTYTFIMFIGYPKKFKKYFIKHQNYPKL